GDGDVERMARAGKCVALTLRGGTIRAVCAARPRDGFARNHSMRSTRVNPSSVERTPRRGSICGSSASARARPAQGEGALAYCLLGESKGNAMMFRVSPNRRLRKLTRLRRHLEAADIAGAIVPEALIPALKPAAREHARDGALRSPVPAEQSAREAPIRREGHAHPT